MAGSEVVAWYTQSVGFGWRALIRNQASASNPIPQADCYLSPPFNSCKLHLLSTGRKEGGVVGPTELFSSACVYAFMNKCLCVHQGACPLSAQVTASIWGRLCPNTAQYCPRANWTVPSWPKAAVENPIIWLRKCPISFFKRNYRERTWRLAVWSMRVVMCAGVHIHPSLLVMVTSKLAVQVTKVTNSAEKGD